MLHHWQTHFARLTCGILVLSLGSGWLDASPAQTIDQAVAAIRARVAERVEVDRVERMPPGTVEALLEAEERHVLGTAYLRFHLDKPGIVSVFRDKRLAEDDEPFWLADAGFGLTDFSARAYLQDFEVWQREYPAGEVGLGVHALRTIREHYFVAVGPGDGGQVPEVTPVFPDSLKVGTLAEGAYPWVDRDSPIERLSPELAGQVLVRTDSSHRSLASVYDYFRATEHPAGPGADQILLTLTEDPARSMAVQWRTDPTVEQAQAIVWRAADDQGATRSEGMIFHGSTMRIEAPRTLNDPAVHRHTVRIDELEPDTEYVYAVGDGSPYGWSSRAPFRTAPEADEPVSFLYFGDVQEGFGRFRGLLRTALRERPEAAFAVFAGDLVGRGNDTADWDAFFAALDGEEAMRSIPIVPAIGNHELLPGDEPDLYRRLFMLPENGPPELEPGRAWSFIYGELAFVIMDSNVDRGQTDWLDERLGEVRRHASHAFAVIHHGAYTSRPGRYYPRVSEDWVPLLEKHGVRFVLQGHDHAYLRSQPQPPHRDEEPGTVYIIATAGGKFYPQAEHAYAATAFANTPTFQVFDWMAESGSLLYRAFDEGGDERDRVVLRVDQVNGIKVFK